MVNEHIVKRILLKGNVLKIKNTHACIISLLLKKRRHLHIAISRCCYDNLQVLLTSLFQHNKIASARSKIVRCPQIQYCPIAH